MSSKLQFGKGSALWKYWTKGKGLAKWLPVEHKWTTLHDLLLKAGVPANEAKGLTTNIITAVLPGYMKSAHTKREIAMGIDTRVMVIDPGSLREDAETGVKGFTARALNYNVRDSFGTSWAPGVFADSIASQRTVPFLWCHDRSDPIGRVVSTRDDGTGLDIDVEFDDFDAVPRAKQAWTQMKSGTMREFSFAFTKAKTMADPSLPNTLRHVTAEVPEFSLVMKGSVPGSKISSIRAADDSGTISADAASDILTRLAAGDISLRAAMVELDESSREEPAPTRGPAQYEIRALVDKPTSDPVATLAEIDKAIENTLEALDTDSLIQARKYFSQVSSKLWALQDLLGLQSSYGCYADNSGEIRADATEGIPAAPPAVATTPPAAPPVTDGSAQDEADKDGDDTESEDAIERALSGLDTRSAKAANFAKPYGAKIDYADTGLQKDGKSRYPLGTKDQTIAAWRYINMPKNSKEYTAAQLDTIKAKIRAAAKKFNVKIATT